jgi:hypothetical protein
LLDHLEGALARELAGGSSGSLEKISMKSGRGDLSLGIGNCLEVSSCSGALLFGADLRVVALRIFITVNFRGFEHGRDRKNQEKASEK